MFFLKNYYCSHFRKTNLEIIYVSLGIWFVLWRWHGAPIRTPVVGIKAWLEPSKDFSKGDYILIKLNLHIMYV